MTTFFAFQHQISVPKNVNFSVPFPNFSQILKIDTAIPGIEKSIRAHPLNESMLDSYKYLDTI